MKFKLELESDDIEQLDHFVKGPDAHAALHDIWQEVFRPARKHGYPCIKLNKLVEETEGAEEIIGALEEHFWNLVNERGLQI